nr:MAG TPA: Helix-turn-helix XRE-family like protein [Caudoviricetes sp.]
MFKRRIQELLFEKNMTQQDLAQEIKMTPATLSRNLNGLNPPKAEVVTAIATFFQVSTDYLLGLSDIRNPEKELNKKQESDPIFFSLYEEVKELSLEQKEDVLNAVKIITKNIKNKNN